MIDIDQEEEEENRTSNTVPRREGSSRVRTTKSAPIIAVRKARKKMGGARPGAGRKRKRPLIVNSEDE